MPAGRFADTASVFTGVRKGGGATLRITRTELAAALEGRAGFGARMTERLTPREVECVRLAGAGLSDKEIRKRLGMGSERTVQGHLARAYAKLGVHDRRTAARLLGNDYPELPVPIPPSADPVTAEPASAVVLDPEGGRGATRSFYDRYAALGRWRQPPRWFGGRSLLILTTAGLILIGLGGALSLLRVVFEVVELIGFWLR